MESNTIFFSYSRTDSEFVLNLAKNLREAGAKIWLDQLDIKPGSRWDKSIEKALATSSTMLVILSKSSVDSNNVMDEVSFALEEKKLVVPILLEQCDIPFRIKRLQFADFTGDHKKGIATLIAALGLEEKVADKMIKEDIKPVIEPLPLVEKSIVKIEDAKTEKVKEAKETPTPPVKKEEKVEIKKNPVEDVKEAPTPPVKKTKVNKPDKVEPKPKSAASVPPKKKSNALKYIIGVVILIGIAAVAYIFLIPTEEENDISDWSKIMKKVTLENINLHLATYQNCIHDTEVKAEFDEIAWKKTEIINSISAYEEYKTEYPNGNNLQKAEEAISSLVAIEEAKELERIAREATIAADKEIWDEVVAKNSVSSYVKYYLEINDSIPNMHNDSLNIAINKIGKEGWLFYGRINADNKMYERVFDVVLPNNDKSKADAIPEIGDYLFVKDSRRTYADSERNNRNTALVKTGEFAMVIDKKDEGNAIIIKVKF